MAIKAVDTVHGERGCKILAWMSGEEVDVDGTK
jgi:hypothetical protein